MVLRSHQKAAAGPLISALGHMTAEGDRWIGAKLYIPRGLVMSAGLLPARLIELTTAQPSRGCRLIRLQFLPPEYGAS